MGIDIYVDGCRFLPDNVTVIRVFTSVIDNNVNETFSQEACLPDLDSDIYNPTINLRRVIIYS